MALASASVRTQLLALVLLLPCFAGIMQHGHGPRSVPLAQHRHRRAHVCRASTVGSSRVQSSLGTTASTLGDTGADSAGAHADIAAWRAGPNPFDLVRPDIELLSHSIKQLLATDHAVRAARRGAQLWRGRARARGVCPLAPRMRWHRLCTRARARLGAWRASVARGVRARADTQPSVTVRHGL